MSRTYASLVSEVIRSLVTGVYSIHAVTLLAPDVTITTPDIAAQALKYYCLDPLGQAHCSTHSS